MIALATTSRGASSASACTAGHEPLAGAVDQERALAAHRLGDERLLAARSVAEPEHGRVELHELQVRDVGARAQRQGDPVAGRDRRVGRGGVDLAHAAGGQHDGAARAPRRRRPAAPSPMTCRVTPAARPSAVRAAGRATSACSMTSIRPPAEPLDARPRQGALRSRPRSRRRPRARCGAAVAALPGELRARPSGVAVEAGAERRSAAARRPGPRSRGRARPRRRRGPPRRSSVSLQVLGGAVAGVERGGDAALRPAGGAVVEHVLGDQQDPRTWRRAGVPQRRGQPGDAGADDDDVGASGPAGRGRGQPSGMGG